MWTTERKNWKRFLSYSDSMGWKAHVGFVSDGFENAYDMIRDTGHDIYRIQCLMHLWTLAIYIVYVCAPLKRFIWETVYCLKITKQGLSFWTQHKGTIVTRCDTRWECFCLSCIKNNRSLIRVILWFKIWFLGIIAKVKSNLKNIYIKYVGAMAKVKFNLNYHKYLV